MEYELCSTVATLSHIVEYSFSSSSLSTTTCSESDIEICDVSCDYLTMKHDT